jgi:hypothetical protein
MPSTLCCGAGRPPPPRPNKSVSQSVSQSRPCRRTHTHQAPEQGAWSLQGCGSASGEVLGDQDQGVSSHLLSRYTLSSPLHSAMVWTSGFNRGPAEAPFHGLSPSFTFEPGEACSPSLISGAAGRTMDPKCDLPLRSSLSQIYSSNCLGREATVIGMLSR